MARKKEATVTKNISKTKHVDDRRKRARNKVTGSGDSTAGLSPFEMKKIIHELHVHQVELETQNEQLRQAQLEITEARTKYADLYDFAPVGYFTFDKKGHIIEANVTGASLLGVEKRSVAKQPFQRFIVPGYLSIFQSHLQKAYESRSKQACELRLTGKEGTQFDALIDTVAVLDGKGKLDHYRAAVKDITERKQAEEALRASEERITIAFRSIPDALVISRLEDGKIVEVNESWHKVFGYSREEVIGKSSLALSLFADPTDRRRAIALLREQGFVRDFELQIRQKSGALRTGILSIELQEIQGEQYLLAVVQDITDRKRAEEALRDSEEKYRYLIQHAPTGIFEADFTARKYLSVNDVMCHYTGYTREEFLSLNPMQLLAEESMEAFIQRHAKVLAGEPVPDNIEFKIKRKDGSKLWALLNTRYSYKPNARILATVIVHDITDRKRAEEALRQTERNFRRSLDESPLGMRMVTIEGETIYANRTILDIYGYDSIEELRTTPLKERYTPESFAEYQIRMEKRKRGDYYPSEYEISIVKKDGEVRHLHVFRKEILWDGERQFQVLYNDITERKRLGELLKKEQQELKLIIDSSPIIVFYKDKDGKFIRVNKAFAKVLELPEGEFVGKTVFDLYSAKFAQGMTNDDQEVIKSGHPKLNITEQHESPSGIRWVQTDKIPICDENGIPLGLIGFAQDITERKWAEEALILSEYKFKELFENMSSSVAVYEATADGENFIFTNFNKAAEETEQIDRKDVIGKSVFDVFPGVRNMGLFEVFQRVWRTGKPEHLPVSLYRDKRIEGWRENYVYKLPTAEIATIYDDVTARKKAEESLRESEARFANIFNASPAAIAITRLEDNRFIDVNTAWQKATGYSREEVIDHTPFELNIWVNRGERDQLISIMLEQGTVRDFLFQLRHKSGTVLEMLMSAELIELAGERYMLSLAHDITERRRTEEALRESETKYRGLYNSTQDGIAMVDIKGHFIECNRAFLDMLGYTGKEIKKMTYQQTTPVKWHDMERSIVINKILKTGYSDIYEKEYIKKDGTVFPVSMRVWATKDEAGNITGLWAIVRDITDRKQAEEALENSQLRLREAMVLAQAANWEFDVESRVFTFDDRFYALYGTSAEREGGNRMSAEDYARNFLFPEDVQIVADEIARAIAEPDHRAAWQLEHRIRRRDGQTRYISVHISVIKDDHGRTVMTRGVNQDITERKLAEESIKASHQQLRALAGRLQFAREEQRKQIAREIHDEMGGALTALKIDLSSLARSAPKSWHKIKSDSFLSKIIGMTKLIDETIGTVRRIVTELRPSILDDFGLMAALEWQLWEFQKRTGIQSEFVSTLEDVNIDEKLSITVFRIFQEALTNVARHANATDVIATLYKEADSLVLKVEDNGKGISEDDIHNTKSVGLIGMRERAFFLGGTVNISGDPSKGTTVSVQFPFRS